MSVKRSVEEMEPVSVGDVTLDDERKLRRRIGRDLAELGLLGEVATRTADAMVAQLRRTGGGEYDALLAGVRVSESLREERAVAYSDRQEKLREVEKLMSGFASELRKFDEVLEVLSTYVRRMRSCTGEEDGDSVLH